MKSSRLVPVVKFRTGSLLGLLLVGAAFPLFLQASSDPTLLPDGRQKMELRPSERNPFAQQIVEEAAPEGNVNEGASEEARLRRILGAVKVGGMSVKGGQHRALVGSLILKPGDTLPPLVKNQFEVLRVVSVDDRSVLLAFVERDSSAGNRQIILPFGMEPEVSQFLFGEAFEELTKVGPTGQIDAPLLTNPGAEDFLKGSKEADLKNIADRDVELMGVVHDVTPPAKQK